MRASKQLFCQSVCPCVCLSIRLCVRLSICLSVCRLTVCLPTCSYLLPPLTRHTWTALNNVRHSDIDQQLEAKFIVFRYSIILNVFYVFYFMWCLRFENSMFCDFLHYVTLTFCNCYVLKLLCTVVVLRYVMFKLWNTYVMNFCDDALKGVWHKIFYFRFFHVHFEV